MFPVCLTNQALKVTEEAMVLWKIIVNDSDGFGDWKLLIGVGLSQVFKPKMTMTNVLLGLVNC